MDHAFYRSPKAKLRSSSRLLTRDDAPILYADRVESCGGLPFAGGTIVVDARAKRDEEILGSAFVDGDGVGWGIIRADARTASGGEQSTVRVCFARGRRILLEIDRSAGPRDAGSEQVGSKRRLAGGTGGILGAGNRSEGFFVAPDDGLVVGCGRLVAWLTAGRGDQGALGSLAARSEGLLIGLLTWRSARRGSSSVGAGITRTSAAFWICARADLAATGQMDGGEEQRGDGAGENEWSIKRAHEEKSNMVSTGPKPAAGLK